MKKSITLLVALVIFAASAFAAPLKDTAEVSSNQTEIASESLSMVDESDTLFADVQAVALTDTEASEIEGAGFFGALFGGIVGGVVGGITGGSTGAVAGAIGGGIMGVCLPF